MDFILFNQDHVADIHVAHKEHEGVKIALNALIEDMQRVGSPAPALVESPQKDFALIVGTVDHSPTIGEIVEGNKLDVTSIQGKWESYMMEVVELYDTTTLVIAGSDKRGTIYGIYELSRMLGVSPWVWWGDSVPEAKSDFTLPHNFRLVQGEPSVQYRGFFLNDEAPSLAGWMGKHFPKVANPQATQGCGSQFYTKVFELLLRLKGNYLWPVMWNNSFHTDDPQNTILADKYGVVMGTSHHEHMTCADKEWSWSGLGDWNYATNRDNIYKFWQDGTTARKNRESILTLGMRGQADTSILGPNATLKDNMDLMQQVINDQRKIIETVHGQGDAVPQMIALYKEVEAFYYGDDTAKLNVPEDVTLMLCDDNFGNLRTLPTQEMLKHKGGFGMYYHFDYRGGPISYEWINQTPLPKIWDNMTNAYHGGIRKIWIVNVGDLKPMELPLDYFMNLAYDFEKWSLPNKTQEFTQAWAAREFGHTVAEETASAITAYLKILGARKAEVVLLSTFEANEGLAILDKFAQAVDQLENIYHNLPIPKKPAFYQMVLYPAQCAMYTYQVGIYTGLNHMLAKANNPLANHYKALAETAFKNDHAATEYYNRELSNGKWDGIMRQNHMGYTSWDGPKISPTPEVLPELFTVAEGESQPIAPLTKAYITINPSQFTANSNPQTWVIVNNYGREFDSVKAMNGEPATLEYSFDVPEAGAYSVNIFTAPTNNPYHHTACSINQQLRIGVQVDNLAETVVSTLPPNFDVGDKNWEHGVMNNVRVVTIPLTTDLAKGQHSLTIKALDPHVVIEKIVIAPPDIKQEIITQAPPTQHFGGRYFG